MKKTRLLNVEEGFTLKPIPPHSRLRWGKLALIYASCMSSIPVLLVGFWLARNFHFSQAILIILVSAFLVLTFNFANSFLGTDTGLSASLIGIKSFGKVFSKIFVSLPLLLVGWGWFSIQLSLAIKSLLVVFGLESLINGPNSTMLYLFLTPIIGALFAFTPITHKAAKFGITNLSIFFISLFCLIGLGFGLNNASLCGFENFSSYFFPSQSVLPFSVGCAAMVGLCASQFVMLSDYSRFSRRVYPDSLLVPLVGIATPQILFGGISLFLGVLSNFQSDFFSALIQVGIPRPIFLLLFFSQWNASRLVVIYSAGLAGASLTENATRKARFSLTILSVIVATCLISLGFQDFFLDFLILQAITFVPVGTVLFVDHLFSKIGSNCEFLNRRRVASIFSLILGLAAGLSGYFLLPESFFPLGSAIASVVSYLLIKPRRREFINRQIKSCSHDGFLIKKENPKILVVSFLGIGAAYVTPLLLRSPFSDFIVLILMGLSAMGIAKFLSQVNGLEVEDKGFSAISILKGERGNPEEESL